MATYKLEDLEKAILNDIYLDKNVPTKVIALYQDETHLYPLDFEAEGPEIVIQIKQAFNFFINTFIQNPNFDTTNLIKNLEKSLVIGVSLKDINKSAGITMYNENQNLFGIFADYNLVKEGVIYHELFHFATRPDKTKHTFPRGLEEGYTEALSQIYLKKGKISYPDNVYYALKLEEIIGKDIMENAYSKGDVKIIKQALGKENDQTFQTFSQNLDILLGSYYRTNRNKHLDNEEEIKERARQKLEECLEKFKQYQVQKTKV